MKRPGTKFIAIYALLYVAIDSAIDLYRFDLGWWSLVRAFNVLAFIYWAVEVYRSRIRRP